MGSVRKEAHYAAYEHASQLIDDEGFRSREPIAAITVTEIYTRFPGVLTLGEAQAIVESALEIIDIERDLSRLPPLTK